MLSSTDCRIKNARSGSRCSIYLGAALCCDGSSTPVRIRNMSPDGAMIEGAALPDVGRTVQLVRSTLIVHGLVIWSSASRCGLKLSGSVDVQQWRALPINVQQQRVDNVVQLVKAGAVPLPVSASGEQRQRPEAPETGEELPADLRRVSELLSQLGDVLAGDHKIVLQYGTSLQSLDIATQVIDAVREVVKGDHNSASDANKLAGLRRSADQALSR